MRKPIRFGIDWDWFYWFSQGFLLFIHQNNPKCCVYHRLGSLVAPKPRQTLIYTALLFFLPKNNPNAVYIIVWASFLVEKGLVFTTLSHETSPHEQKKTMIRDLPAGLAEARRWTPQPELQRTHLVSSASCFFCLRGFVWEGLRKPTRVGIDWDLFYWFS